MEVYRIAKEVFSRKLIASGRASRWNLDDQFILYTGSSRSLSSLELIVHRNSISSTSKYRVLVISIPDEDELYNEILLADLPKGWRSMNAYPQLQQLGNDWYQNNRSLILRVPSAVVPKEYNYLVNMNHPDFSDKIILAGTEDYFWDERLF